MKGLLISFLTTLYLTIISFSVMVGFAAAEYEGIGNNVLMVCFWTFGVISCLLGAANFLLAVLRIFKPAKAPYKTVMICKLVLVPYFILNFVYGVILLISSVLAGPFLIWLLPVVIFLAVLTYGVVVATSSYNAAHLISRLKNGEGPFVEQILFIIAHFIFVIDTIASIILFAKNLKPKTESPGYDR